MKLKPGDRVLFTNQSNPKDNGVRIVGGQRARFVIAPAAPRFYVMLDHLTFHAKGDGDTELLELFEREAERVAAHYESCVPALDGQDYWKWSPTICSLAEFHGPLFHKGFRQCGVTSSGTIDMLIWGLLRGSWGDPKHVSSNSFWNAHHHSMLTTSR